MRLPFLEICNFSALPHCGQDQQFEWTALVGGNDHLPAVFIIILFLPSPPRKLRASPQVRNAFGRNTKRNLALFVLYQYFNNNNKKRFQLESMSGLQCWT